MSQEKPKGPVMIIGGGIAGIQAALSLAGTGYGVYLVEQKASLGGMIPELHRLYPLCACCKLDPRIAACEQDPNIQVMVNTRVLDVSGKVGDFKISLETDGGKKDVEAGAVVLAAGIETFDPSRYETYEYGHLPNVVTSVEYEQLQKPLGPEAGQLKRPSDGKAPEKIAWLQCVGSRDLNQCDAPYCSSVCCMYALKEALNTKDWSEDTETAIFYMDMRTHGKGFEGVLNRAEERDVRLIRSRVHTVDAFPGGDDLEIKYADEKGELQKEIFDMVVLSVGLRPAGEAVELAQKMGVDLTADHFVHTTPFRPVATNVPGIFACGGISGPHDIGQSITQAAASVSEIVSLLSPAPFSPPEAYPEPRDITDQPPEILFAYHLCPAMGSDVGANIEEIAKTMPAVSSVLEVGGDVLGSLVEKLKETQATRVLFGSCTPVVHKPLMEAALKQAGLNPYLYETVDLRVVDPDTARAHLQDRIRMAAARVALISPPLLKTYPVEKRALVVGGGISGLESALALANSGYPVTVVEKEKILGGHARHVRKTWQGYDVQEYFKTLVDSVNAHEHITVMTDTQIKRNSGFPGNFVTTLNWNKTDVDLSHGVTILAAGGDPIKPDEYLYGQNDNVYLWSELALKMAEDPSAFKDADTGVFIQCVGSREPGHPHCSNFCCSFSVRTALDLKERNPEMNLYVLYRDMRTFGERESIYREARERGVIFIRYDVDNKPVVESSKGTGKARVVVYDQVLQRSVALEADFVSLQSAIVGSHNEALSRIFRVNLDANGFLAESPEKLKPVVSTAEGVYMAGLAVYPKDTEASIVQAKAAAAQALEILSLDRVQVGGVIAEVMPEKCAVCCTCVRTCPFDVPFIDHETGAAYIDPGLCRGCGMCVAECPGKAIVMATCSDEMLTQASAVLLSTS
ncbi:MAG: FAD-dependent oxidoreductase [Deltaproteobacteria bacterium]|nr:FAD-dependent oxidoreductase [Deltaproteobacteria bacterium]